MITLQYIARIDSSSEHYLPGKFSKFIYIYTFKGIPVVKSGGGSVLRLAVADLFKAEVMEGFHAPFLQVRRPIDAGSCRLHSSDARLRQPQDLQGAQALGARTFQAPMPGDLHALAVL